ncbi:hypothetical protein Tco_0285695 [Tanacetum coccineum]
MRHTVVIPTGAPATNTVANHAEKPEKFNGQKFKRWQQKMFFYLTTFGLARFLKETVPQVEPPAEGQSSNAQATTSAKELWESLERKYKTEDACTKKFVVARFLYYKMVDSKNVISQVQDLHVLLHDIHAEGMTLSKTFQVAESFDNDGEFGTNRGTNNLVNNEATSSGSSFINIDNDGEFDSNTPIGAKIKKIERQIGEGKLRLLDNDGNPLVPIGIVESDSEVEVVFDETANLRIPTSGKYGSDKGYGTNSLLEQWRDYYFDNDDYDPYDDDIYENHDLSEHLQSICDDLDITICGKKKKWIFFMFVESIVILS